MQKGSVKMLEELEPTKREWILEMATHMARLCDMLEPLKENGIEVSLSTLTRFVRRHKEGQLVSEGEDMKETVDALAKRGRGESFRKGTLEALRQRLYEQAVTSNDPERTHKLFGELLKEEAKLKELELAERKLALAEEQARLHRLRLRMELRARRGQTKERVMDVEAVAVPAVDEQKGAGGEKLLTGASRENAEEREVLGRVREILNRGGRAEEKVLEARAVLAGAEI